MSTTNNKFLPRWLSGKLLLIIFGIIIITHMIAFVFYSQANKKAEMDVNRNLVVRQVIGLIQTIQNKPFDEQQKYVKVLDMPNAIVSIDNVPKYKMQFEHATLWQILQTITKQPGPIKLSLSIENNKWLNISATTYHRHPWVMQFVLLLLEVIAVSAVLFSLWSINRFTTPLKNFMKAADRLGVDIDTKPIKVYGPAIVQDTANAMNQMQERINDLIRDRTQMLAAISHDLRTPITRVKLRAQFIEDKVLYQQLIHDLDEMEAMIAETLSFARADSHKEDKVRLDLASLISSLCDDLVEMGNDVVYHHLDKRIPFFGRRLGLKRVFTNLIENALKYGYSAEVDVQQGDESIIVTIDDKGPGIPEKELKTVFAPYYRGENSRSRATGGTGLGLAVAKDIIRAHGGNIKLENRKEGGLRVTVTL